MIGAEERLCADAAAAPRSVYASFDRFPSAKGAGTHIGRAAQALFDVAAGGLLSLRLDLRGPMGAARRAETKTLTLQKVLF